MRFICPDDLYHFGKASSAGLAEALSCSAQMVNASVISWFIGLLVLSNILIIVKQK
jgi:hypothetical protein